MALAWKDANELAVLAAEKADDRRLSMPERERWFLISERVNEGRETTADLVAVAQLARVDATLQRDAKVAARYRALADRALAGHR